MSININAYTQINMSGKSYCTSGKEAALLMTRNAGKYVSVISLGEVQHIINN